MGGALEVSATGMEGGIPQLLHAIRVPISKPREFHRVLSETSGEQQWNHQAGPGLKGMASPSLSGPDSLPLAPRAMGPCGFSPYPAFCPSRWPEGKWVGRQLEHYQS